MNWIARRLPRSQLTLQSQLMTLAAGTALVAAILASLAAWWVVDSLNQERATARLDRAAEVVRAEYQNLLDDARLIVGLYAERVTLRVQVADRDQIALAEALSTATVLRAIHFLQVTDTTGSVLARVDLGESPSAGSNVAHVSSVQRALGGTQVSGLELDDRLRLVLTESRPVRYRDRIVGSVQGGFFLDQRFVERMKNATSADITLFFADIPFASTFANSQDQQKLPERFDTLIQRDAAEHVIELRDGPQKVRYYPLRSPSGETVGMFAVGLRISVLDALRTESLKILAPLIVLIMVLAALAAAFVARVLTTPLQRLAAEAKRIGAGDLEASVQVAADPAAGAPAEIQALAGAMDDMRQRLIDLNRTREEYLFAVAHELQTPLAALSATTETLVDDEDMPLPDRRRAVTRLRRSVTRVQNLVNNLLDLGSLRAGTFRVRPKPMSLLGAVNDAVAGVEPLLGERHQSVVAEVEPNAARVVADSRRVSQVLVNLLANASKYSSPNDPIAVSAVRDNGVVRISVSDRGPGIPPGEWPTIFQRYYRSAASGDQPGVGLGLAIVKAIVEAHGGEVGIIDPAAKPEGLTIWFTLPAATEEQELIA